LIKQKLPTCLAPPQIVLDQTGQLIILLRRDGIACLSAQINIYSYLGKIIISPHIKPHHPFQAKG
jgi:hypothetical protein